jgi:EAL domain-containing protein (putative c-di-GMP-specific phosphodiesterase class I)
VCFINLSGLSLQDDSVLDFIRDQLSETGVPPNKIGFEITETVAVQNLQQARWFIQEALSIGCRLSLDDFGTGMASYSYLKALPVEYLKIDGGFVESMLSSDLDNAMVESINQISHVLGIQTIAESVGSREVLERVRAIGINHAQGFWIAHPQPFELACAGAAEMPKGEKNSRA